MYAVIAAGGKQFKVQEKDIVAVEKLAGEVGSKVTFTDVFAMGEGADLKAVRFGRGLFRSRITIVQEIIIIWKHIFCFWITIYQFPNTYSFFNIVLSILLIIARQNMIDIAAFSLLDDFRFGWFFDCYIQV